MQNSDGRCNTASATSLSAEELVKQLRKESRQKFLDKIRGSLGSVVHQVAFSPAEAAIACGKSPTWSYRMIYRGRFKVISSDGRLLIPRSELERYLGGAEKYNPHQRRRLEVRGMDVPRKDEPRREPGRHHPKLAIEYGLFTFLSNVTSSVFWWAEQRKWQLADQIEQQEAVR